MPQDLLCAVADAGLEPSNAESVGAASDLFMRAAGLIARVPDLHDAVEKAVMHVHPIDALPYYDVSHSEPRWTKRVFVSVPERNDMVGALRLAESIVHEGMHLILTEWETAGRFVDVPGATMHSPWRATDRPIQGVLHGTFVFVCIASFLSQLPGAMLGDVGRSHAAQRRKDISQELGEVDLTTLRSFLTPRGAAHLDRWTTAKETTAAES